MKTVKTYCRSSNATIAHFTTKSRSLNAFPCFHIQYNRYSTTFRNEIHPEFPKTKSTLSRQKQWLGTKRNLTANKLQTESNDLRFCCKTWNGTHERAHTINTKRIFPAITATTYTFRNAICKSKIIFQVGKLRGISGIPSICQSKTVTNIRARAPNKKVLY